MSEPTLLELLARAETALRAAHEYRVIPEHVPVANGLRSAAARLREEMESVIQLQRKGETVTDVVRRALTRINGGPLPEKP